MRDLEDAGSKRGAGKEQAYAKIKETLFESGDPEQVYSERSLSKRLDIGLASIRSAIGRLQVEGLIVVLPNAGFMLKPLTPRAIADFYEVRTIVEAHVVASLTGHLSPGHVAKLETILQDQAECLEAKDPRTFHRLDMGFHLALARLHGNEEMIRILERLEDRMHRISVELHGRHPDRLKPLIDQHRGILEEITSGDPEVASEKLKSHLAWGRSMLVNGGRRSSSL